MGRDAPSLSTAAAPDALSGFSAGRGREGAEAGNSDGVTTVPGSPPVSQSLPEPEPVPDDRSALSPRERAALEAIAGHEDAVDPAFAARMRSAEAGGPWRRHRDLAIQVAVVVVVAAFLLPTAWVFAAVTVVFLLVLPTALVLVALRETRRRATGPERAAD